MVLSLPDGVELWPDPSPAGWIVERLWPWRWSPGGDNDGPVRIGSFLPDVFEAYARILHPAYRGSADVGSVRWRTLAERNHVVLGPESTFAEISRIAPDDVHGLDEAVPLNGCLPREETQALASLLEAFTTTPERCWFCLWVGQGFWWHGSHSPSVSEDDPSPEARAVLKEYQRVSREIDALMRRTPQVRAQNREYFLFRGALRHADAFPPIEGPWYQSPNIWWPDDRAWCVVTEVDGYSSYLGGTRECVASVLAADDLEAISVSSENRID